MSVLPLFTLPLLAFRAERLAVLWAGRLWHRYRTKRRRA